MTLVLVELAKNIKFVVEEINLNTTVEKLIDLNDCDKLAVLKKAANIIKNDELVAFPTETVYGLGANALSPTAVKKIYVAKGRPSDNPLIVHISDKNQVYDIAQNIPKNAEILMDLFWPGPLTIVLPKRDIIPNVTSGGLDTVAVRMPQNEIARQLIEYCGFPISAPSANTSTKPSPTSANHVFDDLNGKIKMILDGGNCEVGIESTVVEILGCKTTILRAGSVTKEMLQTIIPDVKITENSLKSPGTKYKHYSPMGQVILVDGEKSDMKNYILENLVKDKNNGIKSVVLSTDNDIHIYKSFNTLNIGNTLDMTSIARNLFSVLRECDALEMQKIYVQSFDDKELGSAIMNRLRKSATGNIVNL